MKLCKPYGGAENDGRIQLSFTLPLKLSPASEAAAEQMCTLMNLEAVEIVAARDLGENFSFYIVYACLKGSLDLDSLSPSRAVPSVRSKSEVESVLQGHFQRKVRVLGSCLGTDAHSVGLDAILNRKGCHSHVGLEAYDCFDVCNMGSQVPIDQLLNRILEVRPDVVLISQIVSQNDLHVKTLTEFFKAVQNLNIRNDALIIVGGPRITDSLAKQLGFDEGFGKETLPSTVASRIADLLLEKREKSPK